MVYLPSITAIVNIYLMALVVFLEARGEPYEGKVAVAWVVKNRVEISRRYATTYPEVVFQDRQFSALNDDDVNYPKALKPMLHDGEAFEVCLGIAYRVYTGQLKDPTNGADHYCREDCAAPWKMEQGMIQTLHVGAHVFYRSCAVRR